MAFGFPAYSQLVVTYGKDDDELSKLVYLTIESLNWKILTDEAHYMTGKTINGTLSFGERIYIEIKEGKVGFRSECVIPTQCVDFGKNKKNVELFFSAMKENLPEN